MCCSLLLFDCGVDCSLLFMCRRVLLVVDCRLIIVAWRCSDLSYVVVGCVMFVCSLLLGVVCW